MTNEKLVAAIRHCADSNMTCRGCPLDECADEGLDSWELALSLLAQQAADAIEDLTRAVALLGSDRDAERKLRLDVEGKIQHWIPATDADYHVYEPHYNVVTLCGSTRFKDAFMEAQKRLTLDGNIVISVGLFGHSGDDEVWMEGTKEMLDDMHKRKIDMADEIYVINVGGYIGSSTRSEIDYAKANGKKVVYMEPPKEGE